MLIRLLVIGGLVYVAYRMIKTRMLGGGPGKTAVDDRAKGDITDVMIKDPYCGAYFPKRDGVRLVWKGETFYFCSEACRDKFTETDHG